MKPWLRTAPLLSAFVVGFFQGSPPLFAKDLLMGVLGDSISAASLSDLPIPKEEEPVFEPQFIYENKETLSWASGERIRSHYQLLKASLEKSGEKRALRVLNVSHPGDRTRHLPDQARKLVREFETGRYDELKYITILIGANDVCSRDAPGGTPIRRMRADLMRTFEILSRIPQMGSVRILLVGIPRIPDLGEARIRQSKTVLGLTCETVRNKILNLCNTLLMWENEDEYHRGMEYIEEKNRLLRLVVREANAWYPNLDVLYSNRLYNLEIPRNILAADCFHPGKAAQEAISLEVWLDQPWFD